MSLFFLLFVLLWGRTVGSDLNVGTTLFTKADDYKECWSSQDVALLSSRMILEDLLPSPTILTIDSDEFVGDLVEYFRLILETVRGETHGKSKHITLVALTDLLGGYLYHAVLPTAKYSYYAGLIDYDSMATLLGLFDELKWFLRTNGQGWATPLAQNNENFEVQRIPLENHLDKDQCSNLIFVESEEQEKEQKKRSVECNAVVPIPFFDSINAPSAVALPLKTAPLHNVETNSSSYVLMKFFITAYKCLQMRHANVQGFQKDFNSWMEQQVVPRLRDEKFYAAFGGILRVRSTLRRLGMTNGDVEAQFDEFRQAADEREQPEPKKMNRSSMILMAVLITIFVWFILGTMFICHKMRQNKQKEAGSSPESGGDKTTTCSSLVSSKYFYPEKLDSYRSKKGGRPEIIVQACSCHDDDDGEETVTLSNATFTESSKTNGRLTSIAEMSEKTSTTPKKKSPEGNNRYGQVAKQVYLESTSETEETSEPA